MCLSTSLDIVRMLACHDMYFFQEVGGCTTDKVPGVYMLTVARKSNLVGDIDECRAAKRLEQSSVRWLICEKRVTVWVGR